MTCQVLNFRTGSKSQYGLVDLQNPPAAETNDKQLSAIGFIIPSTVTKSITKGISL
jgi:hypothetical protein